MDNSANEEKPRINGSYDQESIIDRFLDVINIKKLLRIVFDKTPFKVTNSFISGIVLLIFFNLVVLCRQFFQKYCYINFNYFSCLRFIGKKCRFYSKISF